MPSLVNRRSPVIGGYIWYYWVLVVVTLGYKGPGVPELKYFMVDPVIRICGLYLSKYRSFTSLGNVEWLNIVDVVVSYPILPVLGFWSCIF